MKSVSGKQDLIFENVWRKDVAPFSSRVLEIWRDHGGPMGQLAQERLQQLVYIVKNTEGDVVGMSTAFKMYVKRLRNHFFAMRLMLAPDFRIPGLTSKLLVSTRDFLESIHGEEDTGRAIGLITLVENQRLKDNRNEAIWPASKMVYIGNSKEGHPIRVYYFEGARILP